MARQIEHPVRRCAPCDENWPNTSAYNLCPRCQRNTYASTDVMVPMATAAAQLAAKYQAVRDFDALCDAKAADEFKTWAAGMDALLAQTKSIPDPPGGEPAPIKYWDDNRA